jgi:hypothetical protein
MYIKTLLVRQHYGWLYDLLFIVLRLFFAYLAKEIVRRRLTPNSSGLKLPVLTEYILSGI